MAEPLDELIGERLDEVTFIMNYWQLALNGLRLTILTTLEVRFPGGRTKVGEEPFRNRLCEQIGKTVSAIDVIENEAVVMTFEDGSEIRCSIADADYHCPEAINFQGRDDGLYVI